MIVLVHVFGFIHEGVETMFFNFILNMMVCSSVPLLSLPLP